MGGTGVYVAGLISSFLAVVCARPVFASEWEVLTEKAGIVVSRRVVQGQRFPQLRAVGEVPGTPYEVLAILRDVPAQVTWRPDCVESEVVSTIGTWRNVVYTRTNAPWPVADREVVLTNEVTFVRPPTAVKVTFTAIAAPDVPHRKGTVRMSKADGFYEIEAIDTVRSRVHYELDAEPGGSIPDWLIALQSTRNPLETLIGLRTRLQQTRGQYAAEIASFPLAPPAH